MKTYYINNVDCETCARKIEKQIKKDTSADSVVINLVSSKLLINSDLVSAEELTKIANKVEDGVIVTEDNNQGDLTPQTNWKLYRMLISFGLLIIGIISGFEWFYIIGYILVGYQVIRLAFKNILQLQFFDEYFLMTVATFAAFAINQYSEALAVMLFYSIGEYIQGKALDSTKLSISKLGEINIRFAVLVEGAKTRKVAIEDLAPGDVIRVASGERVAVDSDVISEFGQFDTSHISGESEPQVIAKDQLVYAGSVNCGDQVDLVVVATADDSMIAKLVELVTYADSKKTKTEQFITRFSKVYTPIVVGLALLIIVLMPQFTDITQEQAVYRAVTLLVISCPCAFVLSVPLGYVVAIGTLAKQHILVKGSMAIDRLSKLQVLAVDKTGTLTTGQFSVVSFEYNDSWDEDFIKSLVASSEQHIVHPIAKSLYNYTSDSPILQIEDLKQIQGRGIEFSYQGNVFKIIKGQSLDNPYTVCEVYEDDVFIAVFELSDTIKPGIKMWISNLTKRGINVLMLSGDNQLVANEVGAAVGIKQDNIYANLLPAQKLEVVEAQIANGNTVGFVGDGLNDAAVIKRSDLGISMGASGSELSIESSDIVISDDNVTKVASAIDISLKTNRIIKQNIAFAFAVKLIFIILGIYGITTMWEAVFSDVGVTLIAIINSLRIKRSEYDK